MNKKLLIIFPLALVFLLMLSIPKAHAESFESNVLSKHPYGTYHVIDNFYATPNIDSFNVLKKYEKYLMCNGGFPEEDRDNGIYCTVSQFDVDGTSEIFLEPHYGYNKPVYTEYSRVREIESYDGKAEYLIGFNEYDNILIILDGDTFNGNLGDLINDFFKNKVEDYNRKDYEFYMPYSSAAKAGGVSSTARYTEGNNIYISGATYQVGFNLTKESTQTPIENNTEDPAIYGGDNNNQIDETPTEPTPNSVNTPLKIVGIVMSSILGVMGIYVIYILSKKIYKTMKGQ